VNIAAELAELARREGFTDAPAYLTEQAVSTHGEVHGLAARLASVLTGRGVRPGDRVFVALADSAELVALFLAAGRVGAVAVLVNPQLRAPDYQPLLACARPALAVSGPDLEEVLSGGPWVALDRLLAEAERSPEAPAAPLPPDAPLYVQFTSGTTGAPKGAVHRHADLAPYHRAVGEGMLGITRADVTLSVSKMFFAYGFGNSLVYPLFSGSAAVLRAARPTPEQTAELVDRHRVTLLHAVPSAYANLVAETGPEAYRSVRAAVSAGESLPVTLGRRASDLLGVPVLDELGSTEVGGAYCANTPADNTPGTIGRPLAGYRLEVRDKEGGPVPDGTEGRLWTAGPTLLTGYLDNPEETARVLSHGWLATNDTGVRRPDGRFEHTGRADDVEVVGGINVWPREVEAVLLEHPAVREVVVAAVRDERGASKLRAFVVTAAATHNDLEDELLTLARGRLSAFKVPRTVTVVPELPRTYTGKVRRFVARTGRW
jgi:acyl-coenzyme A synthetase/AMP-(fatty) acid ligase